MKKIIYVFAYGLLLTFMLVVGLRVHNQHVADQTATTQQADYEFYKAMADIYIRFENSSTNAADMKRYIDSAQAYMYKANVACCGVEFANKLR